jgi:hypothetical protein
MHWVRNDVALTLSLFGVNLLFSFSLGFLLFGISQSADTPKYYYYLALSWLFLGYYISVCSFQSMYIASIHICIAYHILDYMSMLIIIKLFSNDTTPSHNGDTCIRSIGHWPYRGWCYQTREDQHEMLYICNMDVSLRRRVHVYTNVS